MTFAHAQVGEPGWERFLQSATRDINLDDYYNPYVQQSAFHASPAPHRLIGGAAGPGKTTCLIFDHMHSSLQFEDPIEAKQVHTLLLRRTSPQLRASLIPRFREKVPRELYKTFNEQTGLIVWPNGATTQMGSMQYDADVWNYQGSQFYRIGFDELTQFTWYQWVTIGAWNRCPVAGDASQDGATNPVGVGATWAKALFVDKRPHQQMDDNQRARYDASKFAYFPCTYLDNPIYANDPLFVANLDNYRANLRDALKYGKWTAEGTYFDIWDPAVHIYAADSIQPEPYWPKWISGDWGFEHNFAIYWNTIDMKGICRTYREWVANRHSPGMLAEGIVERSIGPDGKREEYEPYMPFSHDAFHKVQDHNTIALQMSEILQKHLRVQCISGGTDKMGGEQLMYQMLKNQVQTGEYFDEESGAHVPLNVPQWQISDACPKLGEVMPSAPSDPKKPNQIADFLGNDPIDGVRHGIYYKYAGDVRMPLEQRVMQRVTATDPTGRAMQIRKFSREEQRTGKGVVTRPRWRPRG